MKLMMLIPMLALGACATMPDQADILRAAVVEFTEQSAPEYRHALMDLNSDGTDDAIVLMQGMEWCGSGGCTMLVLKGEDDGYTVTSRSTVTRAPIRASHSLSNGWRDLIVHSDGTEKLLQSGGSGYPLNPSMELSATPQQTDSADIVLE